MDRQLGIGMDTLNLSARIRPLPEPGLYRDPGYYCWGPHLFREAGGPVYMVYSRWSQSSGAGGWLTDSEIALAAADAPEGPYEHIDVLLRGRGKGHWDELMAHNPKLKCFDGTYYLYYISSRQGPSRGHIRDSQRIGVAVADQVTGPYRRLEEPLIEPAPPIYNVAVNPGITRMPDGRFMMVVKGDKAPKRPDEPMPQRLQALAVGASPTGPFTFLPDPAVRDIDTEDASIWYDSERSRYYAVFHAHTYIGLITSEDGLTWRRASDYTVTGKRLLCADGTAFVPQRLERPSVYIDHGHPRMLCLGGASGVDWRCVLVPLADAGV